jgi:ABC-type glycerol-3-phosphate transport system substrate-binding protein
MEAAGGSVCAHVSAFASLKPVDATDERRITITRDTIATAMITYPSLRRFPEIEDAGWQAINRALRGELSAQSAVDEVQAAAKRVLQGGSDD